MEEVISRSSEEFKTLLNRLESTLGAADDLLTRTKPSIQNERYYTGEELCRIFHISKRALQDYRDR